MKPICFFLIGILALAGCSRERANVPPVIGNFPPKATGDSANNGGGIAEKNVVFAYLNLDRYLRYCGLFEACRLTPSEKTLLSRISESLPQEGSAETEVVFRSGRKSPGFFEIDGQLRIARTGSRVGSPIYVNTDLLYTAGPHGVAMPLSLADAVALLVHELGHHQGILDHQALDILGSKVETLLLLFTQTINHGPRGATAVVIGSEMDPGFSQLLISDGSRLFDETAKWGASLAGECAASGKNHTLAGGYLENLHWVRHRYPDGHVDDWLQGRVWVMCFAPEMSSGPMMIAEMRNLGVELNFVPNPKDPLNEMLDDSFRFYLIHCVAGDDGC